MKQTDKSEFVTLQTEVLVLKWLRTQLSRLQPFKGGIFMERISQILKDISRFGRVYREEKLAPLGLTPRHGLYLREIAADPGISQEQLAGRISINKSNVARQAAAMEEEGYIERRSCGKDKRVLRLYPTEKALALLPQIHLVMDSWERLLVEELTESEQQALETMLLRLRDSALSAAKGGEG